MTLINSQEKEARDHKGAKSKRPSGGFAGVCGLDLMKKKEFMQPAEENGVVRVYASFERRVGDALDILKLDLQQKMAGQAKLQNILVEKEKELREMKDGLHRSFREALERNKFLEEQHAEDREKIARYEERLSRLSSIKEERSRYQEKDPARGREQALPAEDGSLPRPPASAGPVVPPVAPSALPKMGAGQAAESAGEEAESETARSAVPETVAESSAGSGGGGGAERFELSLASDSLDIDGGAPEAPKGGAAGEKVSENPGEGKPPPQPYVFATPPLSQGSEAVPPPEVLVDDSIAMHTPRRNVRDVLDTPPSSQPLPAKRKRQQAAVGGGGLSRAKDKRKQHKEKPNPYYEEPRVNTVRVELSAGSSAKTPLTPPPVLSVHLQQSSDALKAVAAPAAAAAGGGGSGEAAPGEMGTHTAHGGPDAPQITGRSWVRRKRRGRGGAGVPDVMASQTGNAQAYGLGGSRLRSRLPALPSQEDDDSGVVVVSTPEASQRRQRAAGAETELAGGTGAAVEAADRNGVGGKSDNATAGVTKYERVVRNKAQRAAMRAFNCPECMEFYKHSDLPPEVMQSNCRHRRDHSPPREQMDYWSLGGMVSQTPK